MPIENEKTETNNGSSGGNNINAIMKWIMGIVFSGISFVYIQDSTSKNTQISYLKDQLSKKDAMLDSCNTHRFNEFETWKSMFLDQLAAYHNETVEKVDSVLTQSKKIEKRIKL